MLKKDDQVKIMQTGEIGYIEEVSESGERLKVRVPATEKWPFNHYAYLDKEKVQKVGKGKLPETPTYGEALL